MGRPETSHRTFLSDVERERLLKKLDSQSTTIGGGIGRRNRRQHKRWVYQQSDIAVTVEHPGGGLSRLLVFARNLSERHANMAMRRSRPFWDGG